MSSCTRGERRSSTRARATSPPTPGSSSARRARRSVWTTAFTTGRSKCRSTTPAMTPSTGGPAARCTAPVPFTGFCPRASGRRRYRAATGRPGSGTTSASLPAAGASRSCLTASASAKARFLWRSRCRASWGCSTTAARCRTDKSASGGCRAAPRTSRDTRGVTPVRAVRTLLIAVAATPEASGGSCWRWGTGSSLRANVDLVRGRSRPVLYLRDEKHPR